MVMNNVFLNHCEETKNNNQLWNNKILFLDNKDFFNLNPGFYITHNLLKNYTCFEGFADCENKCIFCCDSEFEEPNDIYSDLLPKKNNGDKNNKIMLCCGEPTNLTNSLKKIKYFKTRYDIVSMTTNGRKLKDINFANCIFQAGLDEIIFSLHGHTSEMHDRVTRIKGSFDETIKGIQNTIKLKTLNYPNLKIGINFVLTKSNIHSLYEIILFLTKFKITTLCFKTLLPFGLGKNIFREEMPSYTTILSEFNKLKHKCGDKLNKLKVFLLDMPFCIFKNSNGRLGNTFLLSKTYEFKHLTSNDCRNICRICNLKSYCSGIFEEYANIYGLSEFGIGESDKKSVLGKYSYLSKNLNFIFQNKKINSLMLMITYECQMDCTYCRVKQKKGFMKKEIYKEAIRLLFSSQNNNILLRFWGGEPLLYPNSILEIIDYAESIKKNYPNKNLRYMITTNCINLTEEITNRLKKFDVELMFSIDGTIKTMKEYRKIGGGDQNYELILRNLDYVKKSGLKYFVNMLVTPLNVDTLFENFNYLVDKGIEKIQIGYETGISWKKEGILKLLEGLEKIKRLSDQKSVFFMNLQNNCEPVMLSDEIIVDVDGKIYYDIAIFHEKFFPSLRKSMFLSDILTVKNLQSLFHTKKQIFNKLMNSRLTDEERGTISNNINLGLTVKELIDNKFLNLPKRTESRNLPIFLNGDISEQIRFKKKYSINILPYILHITNDCKNDCIFCKNKEMPNTSPEFVEYKLKNNLKYGIRKICIVGNEPLNHPKIFQIIDLCIKYGFKDIQIMTSAMFLTDTIILKRFHEKGVNSFSMPIYSISPDKHDKIVQRRGDFNDLIKAVNLLKSFKNIHLHLHTNVLKQNIDELNDLEEYVHQNITLNFCILPIRSKTSNFPYADLIPSYTEMIQKLKVKSLVGFPLCVIKKIQGNLLLDSDKISDSIKVYMLDQNYVKLKKCKECKFISNCVGTFKDYVRLYGYRGIYPIKNK